MKLQQLYKGMHKAGLVLTTMFLSISGFAQVAADSAATESAEAKPAKVKPVKNTFESVWIIDNQTVMVPVKKTFVCGIMEYFALASHSILLLVIPTPIFNLLMGE